MHGPTGTCSNHPSSPFAISQRHRPKHRIRSKGTPNTSHPNKDNLPRLATQFVDHWNVQTLVQARFDPVRFPKVTPAFPLRGSLSKLDKLERSCRFDRPDCSLGLSISGESSISLCGVYSQGYHLDALSARPHGAPSSRYSKELDVSYLVECLQVLIGAKGYYQSADRVAYLSYLRTEAPHRLPKACAANDETRWMSSQCCRCHLRAASCRRHCLSLTFWVDPWLIEAVTNIPILRFLA